MSLTTDRSIIINNETMFSGRNSYENIGFPEHLTKIEDPIGLTGDSFGFDVAVGDSRIVVGSYIVSVANVFDLNGNHISDLLDPVGEIADEFGRSVAVGNGIIVVGAPDDNSNRGSVHIFDLDGNYVTKIEDPSGSNGHYFGLSVSVGSGRIVAGAYGAERACIFDLDGNYLFTVTDPTGVGGDYFGKAVAVANNRIVVGADYAFSQAGSVSMFDLDGNHISNLSDPNSLAGDRFGIRLAGGSGRIVVGAYGDGAEVGAAHIFDLDGNHITQIVNPTGDTNHFFSIGLSIGSGRIVVGENGEASNKGAIHIFDLDGNYITQMVDPDGEAGDNFGYSCAVGNGRIVAGSYGDTAQKGSATIFSLTDYIHSMDLVDKESNVPPFYSPVEPDALTNLLSWYDFSDISTLYQDTGLITPVTANGQNIRGVSDKGSGGVNLTKDAQSPASKDITLVENAHFGKSMAQGSTYENFNIAYLSNTAYGTALTDFFVAGVIQVESTVILDEGRFFTISDGFTARVHIIWPWDVDMRPYLWINGNSQSGYTPTDLTPTRLNVTVGFYWWAPYGVGGGVWEVYGLGSNTKSTIHTTLTSTDKIGLFGNTNATFTGKIGEMVIARSTTETERKGVLEYFNQKWQL